MDTTSDNPQNLRPSAFVHIHPMNGAGQNTMNTFMANNPTDMYTPETSAPRISSPQFSPEFLTPLASTRKLWQVNPATRHCYETPPALLQPSPYYARPTTQNNGSCENPNMTTTLIVEPVNTLNAQREENIDTVKFDLGQNLAKQFHTFKHKLADSVSPKLPTCQLPDAHERIERCKQSAKAAKSDFLNWIYPDDQYFSGPRLPPCPPCADICQCVRPSSQIIQIQDQFCVCGAPGTICEGCRQPSRVCPACGQPYKPKSLFCCTPYLSCASAPEKAPTPPTLLVTSAGPFQEANQQQECLLESPCGASCTCFQDAAHGAGLRLTCCRPDPPPAPFAGRPIQNLLPGLFPPTPPPRVKFPWNLWYSPKPYQPPRGGIIGFAEDFTLLGVNAARLLVDSAADVFEQLLGPSKLTPGSAECTCSLPPLRYPKNGVYADAPDFPTRSTGWRFLDAVNNFLDAASIQPSNPEDVYTVSERETSDTDETGNPVIDCINRCLDRSVASEARKTPRPTYEDRDPITALKTYFTEKPRPLPKQVPCILECFAPDEIGENWFDRNCPNVCFGENIPELPDTSLIDYVNFDILPSGSQQAELLQGSNDVHIHQPVIPVERHI